MTDIVVRPAQTTPVGTDIAIRYTVSATDGTEGESTVYVPPSLTADARDALVLSDARAYMTNTFAITAGYDFLVGGWGPPWRLVLKRTDQIVNNSTVLVDDETLQLQTAGASFPYHIRLRAYYTTGTVSDFKYRLTFSGTASILRRRILRGAGGAAPAEVAIVSAFDAADVSLTGTGIHGVIFEDILMLASAGTLKFTWAQNTAQPEDTKVLQGSYLEWAGSL